MSTETHHERVLELAQNDWSTNDIAVVTRLPVWKVRRWRREAGLTARRGNPVVQAEVDRWAQLYRDGINVADIASKAGRNPKIVAKHLADAGLLEPERKRKPRRVATSSADVQRYAEYAAQGYSAERISEIEGVSASTVRRRLYEHREEEQGE